MGCPDIQSIFVVRPITRNERTYRFAYSSSGRKPPFQPDLESLARTLPSHSVASASYRILPIRSFCLKQIHTLKTRSQVSQNYKGTTTSTTNKTRRVPPLPGWTFEGIKKPFGFMLRSPTRKKKHTGTTRFV